MQYVFFISVLQSDNILFSTKTEVCIFQKWTAEYWVSKGAPKHKLVIGIAAYGHTYRLSDPSRTGVGAQTVGAGQPGRYTGGKGFLAYYEVQALLYVFIRSLSSKYLRYTQYKCSWISLKRAILEQEFEKILCITKCVCETRTHTRTHLYPDGGQPMSNGQGQGHKVGNVGVF